MNQIGPTLPPVAAAPTAPGDSETASTQAPEGDGTFDALLQQRSEEPVEVAEPAAVIASETEPAAPHHASDAADALISAGLIGMFAMPVVAPLPAPVQRQPLDLVASDSCVERAAKQKPIASPEIPARDYSQPADIATATPFAPAPFSSAPISPAPQPTKPVAIREVAARPLAQPIEAPPPDPAATVLKVATVRGLIPPVQSAPVTPVEVTHFSPPTPAAAVAIERDDRTDPAIPATTPGTVPATLATGVEQPIATEKNTPVPEIPMPNATMGTVPIPVEVAAISKAEIFHGMVAAKPGRAMSAPTLQRSQSSTAAAPAGVSANGKPSTAASFGDNQTTSAATSFGEPASLRNVPVVASETGRERPANEPSENRENPSALTPDFPQTIFSSEPPPAVANTAPVARIQQTDVAQVVNHTLAAVERLRASGQERVEVALKLEGGQELTIQLHVANGQVTPTIRTESEPLRLALEQNWSQFSQRSGERELQITKPVFESPQTSSNMTDLSQQRDGRQRVFQESAGSFAQPYLPRRNLAPGIPQTLPPVSTPQTGVRLYA